MSSQFKKGDLVRILDPQNTPLLAGDLVLVLNSYGFDGAVEVKSDRTDITWLFNDEDVELASSLPIGNQSKDISWQERKQATGKSQESYVGATSLSFFSKVWCALARQLKSTKATQQESTKHTTF